MKRMQRTLIILGCIALLAVSWFIVLGAETTDDRQSALISQAQNYLRDEIYILAVPLLEEAANLNASRTEEAEDLLKNVYFNLIHQTGFRRAYLDLLDRLMSQRNDPAIFKEAANFHLISNRHMEAFEILRNGIERTGDIDLINLFESVRYIHQMSHSVFDNVTAPFESTIGVELDGYWGIASVDGRLIIPTMYSQVSTFSNGRAIVQRDDAIFAVDRNNNRIALLREHIYDFGNYSQGRISIQTVDGWRRASSEFDIGAVLFEWIGTYSSGYAAAKQNGRWGIVDTGNTWLVPPEHSGIVLDELGRAFAQNAAFIQENNGVTLFVNGQRTNHHFEDAHPFTNTGYAAVRINGSWGFIDAQGNIVIKPQFDDARSFSQHLGAVRIGEYWGFISLRGEVVIEPVFLATRGFYNGSASVLTYRGWRFITLIEYRR